MRPDLVLDTNVALEQVDVQDLVHAIVRAGDLNSPRVRARRRRARHSILLGWHCHTAKLSTAIMWHEVAAKMLQTPRVDVNASGDLPTVITSLIVHFVLEKVLCDWRRGVLGDIGSPSGTAADDALLQWAKDARIPLITNEGDRGDGTFATERAGKLNLRGKAVREGVTVYSPEEFLAARSVDISGEARRFLEAFDEQAGAGVPLPWGVSSPGMTDAALDRLAIIYKYTLLDP